MPKARRRYNMPGRTTIGQPRTTRTATVNSTGTANAEAAQSTSTTSPRLANRRTAGNQGVQNLVWPVMVTLACWGLAYTFLFYSANPNHNVFAGMAILMALLWTFIFGLRVRRLRQVRQETMNR